MLLPQEQGGPGRAAIVALPAVPGVGELPVVDGTRNVGEPPEGSRKAIESVGDASLGHIGFEDLPGRGPFPGPECLPPVTRLLARAPHRRIMPPRLLKSPGTLRRQAWRHRNRPTKPSGPIWPTAWPWPGATNPRTWSSRVDAS